MKMLDRRQLEEYIRVIDFDIDSCFNNIKKPENGGFDFLLEASAVYSSNIEGNTMDLNSFMNSKTTAEQKPKEFNEIVDLKEAYDFARSHKLTEENFLEAHKILSRLIVSEGNQGAYRQDRVGVFSSRGLEYMAVEYENVVTEMRKLFEAIATVTLSKLQITEAIYLASMVHLNLAHIHPFADGNGRVARLLEKWLLAELLGENAWLIESEKFYKENLQEYYKNIALGQDYYNLDYDKSLPFLNMLPKALRLSCSE